MQETQETGVTTGIRRQYTKDNTEVNQMLELSGKDYFNKDCYLDYFKLDR